ncbi:MAG: tRNA (guanosine(46)-N7)-methyltransferase TrmB [Gammaproteobacteria bacterium]|nr:tRNA (guanosine(46)-N7)-methyltransferase TrmB [Gammaproteobacteria bacterium]
MTDSDKQPFMRQVRSFVLREGRMTKGQERAMQELFPALGIEFQPQPLDFLSLFGNDHPVVLEIGFGMGKSLALQARANPQRNYLGIEVHRPGVGACLLLAEEYQLTNLRVINHDAVEVLKQMIGDASLGGMQVYFPDPWHKKKHHKRRIVQPSFIDLCAQKVAKGGFIHLATDWENYAEHMLAVMSQADGWGNLSPTGDYIERPEDRPITKFETRGTKLGHGVWDLMYERCD